VVEFVKPTSTHIRELADNLRSEDWEECAASGFKTPLEAVTKGVELSFEPLACVVDGETMGIFGLTANNILNGDVSLWMLTSEVVNRKPKTFVKIVRDVLSQMRSRWRSVSIGIDAHHQGALRLATRSSFKCLYVYAHDATGEPFVRVIMEG
jgi:hypothetical protein